MCAIFEELLCIVRLITGSNFYRAVCPSVHVRMVHDRVYISNIETV